MCTIDQASQLVITTCVKNILAMRTDGHEEANEGQWIITARVQRVCIMEGVECCIICERQRIEKN
jgi:hypothetical protein